jgi:hypothetical protein
VRAASAVSVTGEALAIGCSQLGSVATGTKTELAKTSGKSITNPFFAKVDGRWYFAERDLILDWSETRVLSMT